LDTRADTKGRPQPANKPKLVVQSQKLHRDSAIVAFASVLRAKARETLEDLAQLLRDEQARIEALPMPVRVELAHGFLRALMSAPTICDRRRLSLPSSLRQPAF
jgi:hypothetical protein